MDLDAWARWSSMTHCLPMQGVPDISDDDLVKRVAAGDMLSTTLYAQRLFSQEKDVEAFEHYLRAAQTVAIAAHNVAAMYEEGIGVEADRAKALDWYRRAAARKCGASMYRLGFLLAIEEWDDVPKLTRETGLDHMRSAADAGVAPACLDYGMMHILPAGGIEERDVKTGIEWLQRAIARGSGNALYELARINFHGIEGVEKDEALAGRLAAAAAKKDHALALEMAGFMHRVGVGLPHSMAKAREYFKRAGDKGVVSAMRDYALILEGEAERATPDKEALERVEKEIAEIEIADAKSYANAFAKIQKRSTSKKNKDKLVAFLDKKFDVKSDLTDKMRDQLARREAVDKADATAREAIEMHVKASQHGDAISMLRLALGHENQFGGLEKDPERTLELLRRSAEAGCLAAKAHMIIYKLVDDDDIKQFKADIASIAADDKHPGSKNARNALVSMGHLQACAACGVTKYDVGATLKACKGCGKNVYCSAACQEHDWQRHRVWCAKEAENADANGEGKAED